MAVMVAPLRCFKRGVISTANTIVLGKYGIDIGFTGFFYT